MEPSELSFDRIEIEGEEGVQAVTPAEFVQLDVAERVRIVLSGSIRFTRAGVRVETLSALSQLRQLRVER